MNWLPSLEIILTLLAPKNMAWCEVGENGCRCRLTPLRWLQSMSSRTNVALNILYRLSTCLPSCHHQYEVNLAEVSFKIRQHLTVFATRRHL